MLVFKEAGMWCVPPLYSSVLASDTKLKPNKARLYTSEYVNAAGQKRDQATAIAPESPA